MVLAGRLPLDVARRTLGITFEDFNAFSTSMTPHPSSLFLGRFRRWNRWNNFSRSGFLRATGLNVISGNNRWRQADPFAFYQRKLAFNLLRNFVIAEWAALHCLYANLYEMKQGTKG